MAFLTQNKAKLWKKLIITLVFEKNAESCKKSPKIVILTSTPVQTSAFFRHFRVMFNLVRSYEPGVQCYDHDFWRFWPFLRKDMLVPFLYRLRSRSSGPWDRIPPGYRMVDFEEKKRHYFANCCRQGVHVTVMFTIFGNFALLSALK
jgi:hypothetical protein